MKNVLNFITMFKHKLLQYLFFIKNKLFYNGLIFPRLVEFLRFLTINTTNAIIEMNNKP